MARGYYGEEDDTRDLVEDYTELEELGIPDVYWKEDIEHIDDPKIKLQEIKEAEKYWAKQQELGKKVDSGEISVGAYQSNLQPMARKACTRCALESVRISFDDLGSLSEDAELLVTGEGDLKMTELKDRLKEKIERIGPDAAEDRAKRMHDDDEIGDDAYDCISRQIRIERSKGR